MTDYRTQIVITLLVIQRFVHLILFLIKLESHLRQRYLWGPAVDQILAEENVDNGADETVQWTLTDHLNTVRDIAKYDPGSEMTTVVNHLIYDAFGRVTSESNPASDSLFLFSGRPFDSDTQLQNNLNRWYDARVGRWLSEDPIGFSGGDANLYRYVGNGVPTRLDPRGLEANRLRTLWQVIEIAYNVLSMADRAIREPLGIYGPGAGPAAIKGLKFEVQEPNVAAEKVAQTEFPVSLGAFQIVSATHAVPLFLIQVAMTQSFLGIDWVVPDSVLLRYAKAEHPLTLEQIRQRNLYELPDIRIERVCQLDRSLKVSINDQSTVIRTRTGRYEITIYGALFLIPIYMPSEYPGFAVGPILSVNSLLKYVVAFPLRQREPICCYR